MRYERQAAFDRGELPVFLDATRDLREGSWKVAAPAPGLVDRRVEITGPTDRKMTINALNSAAKVWLADFEDANAPSWSNMVEGQANLRASLDGSIGFVSPEGKVYELGSTLATIAVRPRGWHLLESHVRIDGEAVSASLFDFAIYLWNCGKLQLERGLGPYYYLPKLESHLEARLWNDAFDRGEDVMGFARGSIRATVLIETFPAAFEMEEILFELRTHSAGLNAGRWDYLFSIIKKLRNLGAGFVLPDRNSVTMAAPFMGAYADLLVQTCHRRGAHAIGGMAAFIPSRHSREVNEIAFAKVREDKEREARSGFDGSWVAHPGLVPVCFEVFNTVLGDRPNQLEHPGPKAIPSAADLTAIEVPGGACTFGGLVNNVSVALQYLASWLGGSGAVAIFDLMEDAATAEIARSQVWQWIRNRAALAEGVIVEPELVRSVLEDELARLETTLGDRFDVELYDQARELFIKLALDSDFPDFLTVAAYDSIK